MTLLGSNSGVTAHTSKRTAVLKPHFQVYKWSGAQNGVTIRGNDTFILAASTALDSINALPTGQQILSIIDAANGPDSTTPIMIGSTDDVTSGKTTDGGSCCNPQKDVNCYIPNQYGTSPVTPPLTPAGTPAGSGVIWNSTYMADGRDPAIGLAHELIHAVHHLRGESLAFFTDPGESTAAHPEGGGDNQEEARTIGMHGWGWSATDTDHPSKPLEPLSENKIRMEWNSQNGTSIPMRTTHSSLCCPGSDSPYCPGPAAGGSSSGGNGS